MKNRENAKYIKLGLTGAAVVAFGLILSIILYRGEGLSGAVKLLMSILRSFLYGGVIAYLVTPLARKLGRLMRKPDGNSGLANALAVIIAIVLVLAILLLIIPQVVSSVVKIVNAMPAHIERLKVRIQKLLDDNPALVQQINDLTAQAQAKLRDLLKGDSETIKLLGGVANIASGALSTVTGFLGLMLDLFIGVIVALYLLSKRGQLASQASMILRAVFKPSWADWIENEVRFADRMFNGFFMGKLLDSAIIGLICFVGCLIMGFKSALLIAVIVGVTNIIPFFGPYIGAIPSALLLLLENPIHCLMFLAFIIVLQQIDGNIIGPKILGDSTGLSALWVMFGILLFGGLWGIVGMLVGVPLMAIIYDIIRQLTYRGVRRNGREDLIDAYNAKFHSPATASAKKKK